MKTFILKVIGITLIAVIAVLAIGYSVFMIFFPATLASFYDGIGAYDAAVFYSYRNYERTEDKSDLNAVCRYALKTGDSETAIKYLDMLVDGEFYEFCAQEETLGETYYNFITGKLVTLKYYNGESANGCVDLARGFTRHYTNDCALRAMIFSAVDKNDRATLNYVKSVIQTLSATLEGDEKLLADDDLTNLNEFLI
ncbi:MAG: hypothetical protein J6Y44_02400 [Clostridia bacterium]|nr:hypothetical protein [Clostridia bacterium]